MPRLTFRSAIPWLALFIVWGSLFFLRDLNEIERGALSAFSHSFLEDGDLNIINHVVSEAQWLVTRAFNHPTNQNHGSVIFWTPWYALAYLLPASWRSMTFLQLTPFELLALFRNSIFVVLAIFLLDLGREKILASSNLLPSQTLLPKRVSVPILLAFVLSTPLYLFLFYYPFSAEVTTFFLAAAMTYHLVTLTAAQDRDHSRVPRGWVASGLFVGLATVFKTSLAVYALPYAWLAVTSNRGGWKRAGALILGILLIGALQAVNYSIQMGEFTFSSHLNAIRLPLFEANTSFHNFVLAPNGLLTSSPVLIFTLVLALGSMADCIIRVRGLKRPDLRLRLGFSAVIIGHFLILYLLLRNVASFPDHVSSRLSLGVIPPGLMLVYLNATYFFKLRWRFALLWVALGACLLLNAVHIAGYLRFEATYPHWITLTTAVESLRHGQIWQDISRTELAYFLFAGAIGALGMQIMLGRFKNSKIAFKPIFKTGAALLAVFYLAITVLNWRNNPKKVARLTEQGFFKNTVVSATKQMSYYDEVTSCLEWGIQGLPQNLSKGARQAYEAYTLSATGELLADPIGLREKRLNGMIRPSVDVYTNAFRRKPGPPEQEDMSLPVY